MGFMGLALTWETRIPPVTQRERRVEPFQDRANATTSNAADAARLEDAALAAACASGDLHAYERLYSLQGARMKNLARNILGTTLDAEDAVQETFLKIQRSISSFRGQSSFITWTFRILVNTCYDFRRSRLRKKEVATEDQTSDDAPRPEPRAPGAHPRQQRVSPGPSGARPVARAAGRPGLRPGQGPGSHRAGRACRRDADLLAGQAA